jgi:hypothetical protein
MTVFVGQTDPTQLPMGISTVAGGVSGAVSTVASKGAGAGAAMAVGKMAASGAKTAASAVVGPSNINTYDQAQLVTVLQDNPPPSVSSGTWVAEKSPCATLN